MGGGNTGAGASKHFVSVPPWDAQTQATFAGLVQKYSVQNWNAFRLVCHIVQLTHSKRVPFSLHRKISGCFSRLTTSLEHVFKPRFLRVCKPDRQLSNEIETRLALRKEQRLSRNDAAKRGAINRQQAEALRRRTHRHELLAGLSKGSEAMRTPENRHQLNMFAELLAQGDTITAASGRLSISRQRGGQLLAKLRRELGWQAQ